jgi:DNA-binding MarR family transcriptional regulator
MIETSPRLRVVSGGLHPAADVDSAAPASSVSRGGAMRDSSRLLGRIGRGGLPIRLLERFTEDPANLSLDRSISGPYYSSMNQSGGTQTANRSTTTAEVGATLVAFLDVADLLYDRISDGLARVGLSYAKYEILKQLQDKGGPVTLGALAEGASCARSNITQIVDRLEQDGLVRRVDDPDDRRSVRAELTEAGEALAAEGTTQLDLVKAQFAASFTAAERVDLARLLAKLG